MATVTVAGAHGQTVTLSFDTNANAVLAQKLADAITSGVQAGSILPAVDTDGPPPPVPAGKTGEFVITENGAVILPQRYDAVVNTANDAIVFGSGDAGESVLSSIGNLTFFCDRWFRHGRRRRRRQSHRHPGERQGRLVGQYRERR